MKHLSRIFLTALAAAALLSCNAPKLAVVEAPFGTLEDGGQAKLYTLTNSNGASLAVSDYGARIVSIFMPDRDGVMDDVVVGPGDLSAR